MSQSVIFISYRHEDSYDLTGRLASDLMDTFGKDAVFQDIERIDGGDKWSPKIEFYAKSCSVMLIVIGGEWAEARYGRKTPKKKGRYSQIWCTGDN